jgi:tRNA (cytidine/uridine-2'-O-)-methyltransferase
MALIHVVLFQPEIPPNTGNIIRLCANTGARLHLIEPLGFELEDKQLKRAGLDYHEWATVKTYPDLTSFIEAAAPARLLPFSTRAKTLYADMAFRTGDALLFGPETRGLPTAILESVPPEQRLRLPMLPGNRSLNLSNTVAVAVYEVWRQLGFVDGE